MLLETSLKHVQEAKPNECFNAETKWLILGQILLSFTPTQMLSNSTDLIEIAPDLHYGTEHRICSTPSN